MPDSYSFDSDLRSTTSSSRPFFKRKMGRNKIISIVVGSALLAGIAIAITVVAVENSKNTSISQLLSEVPLIDGHNDLPWQLFGRKMNRLEDVDLNDWPEVHTDIPRLRKGKVGAQFWALYVDCDTQYKDVVRACLDQADVIHRFINNYSDTFQLAVSTAEIRAAFAAGKIASMIGMEGGHCIDSSLASLRLFYQLGVRYMTITHSCDTPWAGNWILDRDNVTSVNNGGLTDFGKDVIREMNRLGMLVDLSHVSKQTMIDALKISVAPVIYSHSGAYELCKHFRNVQDDVLQLTKQNRGIVMVNFYNDYVTCSQKATISDVADHIDYIKKLIGVDYVGIGGDYDGVPRTPQGLEDVSKYPALFETLRSRGWTDDDLKKLAGNNLLRVFEEAENISRTLQLSTGPLETIIPHSELGQSQCRHINGSFVETWTSLKHDQTSPTRVEHDQTSPTRVEHDQTSPTSLDHVQTSLEHDQTSPTSLQHYQTTM